MAKKEIENIDRLRKAVETIAILSPIVIGLFSFIFPLAFAILANQFNPVPVFIKTLFAFPLFYIMLTSVIIPEFLIAASYLTYDDKIVSKLLFVSLILSLISLGIGVYLTLNYIFAILGHYSVLIPIITLGFGIFEMLFLMFIHMQFRYPSKVRTSPAS